MASGIRTLLGLIGTVGGAWLLVQGGTDLADEVGLTGGFVGLTLVAIGTSLPEMVTAVVAARKGEVWLAPVRSKTTTWRAWPRTS